MRPVAQGTSVHPYILLIINHKNALVPCLWNVGRLLSVRKNFEALYNNTRKFQQEEVSGPLSHLDSSYGPSKLKISSV